MVHKYSAELGVNETYCYCCASTTEGVLLKVSVKVQYLILTYQMYHIQKISFYLDCPNRAAKPRSCRAIAWARVGVRVMLGWVDAFFRLVYNKHPKAPDGASLKEH